MKKNILLFVTLTLVKSFAFGQNFEGEITYKNFYLDKDSLKPLFTPLLEMVYIKGSKYKSFMPNAEKGALEWQINDYEANVSYSRNSYQNIDYFVTDKEPVISQDGKIQFSKPDSQIVAPIMRGRLCNEKFGTSDSLVLYDKKFMISGFDCNLIIRYSNGVKTSEYYYTDSIKIDQIMFNCSRSDCLDLFYKKTKGAFIIQQVEYDDLYIWIQQAQSVQRKILSDSIFELPKDVKIVDYKEN